jgi:hypothetical protein
MAGIFTRESDICWSWSWCASLLSPRTQCNAHLSQAAKDARRGQDTLVDIFERIESFFRCIVIYAEVPPTTEMMDTIIQIMVEVLSVLGIATKEIRQCRMSELFSTSMSLLTEQRSEKYGKKLIEGTDMVDALKRLDKLTHAEARMATAEVLRAVLATDEGVMGFGEQVLAIDDRVASVDDKVAGVVNGA